MSDLRHDWSFREGSGALVASGHGTQALIVTLSGDDPADTGASYLEIDLSKPERYALVPLPVLRALIEDAQKRGVF